MTTVLRTIADVAISGMAAEQVVNAANQVIDMGLVDRLELASYAEARGGALSDSLAMLLGRVHHGIR